MPKLIISDIMMPGAYGSAAYKALQEDPHTRNVPVLFLTAAAPEQAAKVVPSAANVRLMHKPVDLRELLAAVNDLAGA